MLLESLAGKLAIVTGGASGIGKSTCQVLAKLGSTVIVTDLKLESCENVKKELPNQSLNHSAHEMDVSWMKSIEKTVTDLLAKYKKPPTIVIHAAGIAYDLNQPTLETTEENWTKTLDVNLKGTFYVNKTFVKLMHDAKLSGSIVNFSSIAKDGYPRGLPYSASKAGVVGITRTIAKEFGAFNIRCNAVAPGVTDTPMGRQSAPDVLAAYVNGCALKRMARPEEVANLCAFLGSDESSYVNGEIITIDGCHL